MNSFPKILLFLAIFSAATSCVTTRDQLNQQRGIHGDGEEATEAPVSTGPKPTVKSEDLPTQTKKTETPSEPEVIQKSEATPAKAEVPPTAPEPGKSVGPVLGPVPPAAVATGEAKSAPKDYSDYNAEELRAELARMSGKVEELQHDREITEKERSDAEKKNADRIADLEKKLKEIQPDAPKVPEGQTPLEAGKEAFAADKYDDAILFTSQALEKKDTGKEAEEATYIRGEAYFKKQQYNKAIVDFSHFPEKFQKSSYHPKALLRIGECFEQMGRKDDARAFYSDLVDKFPKTAEGKLAKKRLKLKK